MMMNNCCMRRCCCTNGQPQRIQQYALLPYEERHDGKVYFVPESVIPCGATIMVRNDGSMHIRMNGYSRW